MPITQCTLYAVFVFQKICNIFDFRHSVCTQPLADTLAYLSMNYFILFVLVIFSCKKTNITFDEIQILTYTDSSRINLFISNDSIVIIEYPRGKCENYLGCKYGPKYYAKVARHKNIFPFINKESLIILSDSFQLERMVITHTTKSKIKYLIKDSLIKEYNYYGSEKGCENIIKIQNFIFKAISKVDRNNINIKEHLFDVSDLKYVDSIRITKLKSVILNGSLGKYTNFNKDYTLVTINNKTRIDSFINCLSKQIILDTTESKLFGNFIPKYEIDFYKKGLIRFQLETDLKIIPYFYPQTLKVDSCFVRQIQ